jgi:Fe-S-cluster containining protein
MNLSAGKSFQYDCQKCGPCCTSPWTGDGYVRLYDSDRIQLQETNLAFIQEKYPEEDPPELIYKLSIKFNGQGNRICVALEGSAGKECACQIYSLRPLACRRFEVGGVCAMKPGSVSDW